MWKFIYWTHQWCWFVEFHQGSVFVAEIIYHFFKWYLQCVMDSEAFLIVQILHCTGHDNMNLILIVGNELNKWFYESKLSLNEEAWEWICSGSDILISYVDLCSYGGGIQVFWTIFFGFNIGRDLSWRIQKGNTKK